MAATANALHTSSLPTPLGNMRLYASEDALLLAAFEDTPAHAQHLRHVLGQRGAVAPIVQTDNIHTRAAAQWLDAYFSGAWITPAALAQSGTAWQQKVWGILQNTAPGQTLSYQALAQLCGTPLAARAVAAACAANRLLLFVPCHRVISARHAHTGGYSGQVWRKQWLIQHESAMHTT